MRKIHLLSALVALIFATTSLWAKPAVADANGKLPCRFSVSATQQVYFSQGNLQYNSDNQKWQFADEQYQYIGNTTGNTNITADGKANNTGTADLFGWVGASSSWTGLKQYGLTSSDRRGYVNGYGNVANEPLKSDWGTLKISNGGNTANFGWFTLTTSQWAYILSRTGAKAATVNGTKCAYAKASVNGNNGIILFPDGGTFASSEFSNVGSPNNPSVNYTTTCTKAQWQALEGKGCVFLPAAGYRNCAAMDRVNSFGRYWSSRPDTQEDESAYGWFIEPSQLRNSVSISRLGGSSVRLVIYATDEAPTASVTTAPVAVSDLTYDGSSQELVTGGVAAGGSFVYKFEGESDVYYRASITAENAGIYTIRYMVEGAGCINDFTPSPNTVEVTIARASFTPNPMQTVEAASLTYTGSAQDLLSVSGSLQSGCEIQYSTDGVNWSTTMPQGTNVGDYTVYYKVVNDPNYEYIPSPDHFDVTIAPANIVLPAIETDLVYTGSPLPLISVGTIPEGTIYYSTDGINWTTEVPIATEIGAYDVWYKVEPADPNYNSIPATKVTVTIDDPYPFVADNADPTTKLTELLNTSSDLKVKRTIYADDEYNTICLPFALDESALAASPLAGFNRLKTFKGAQVTGTAPDLYIDIFVEDATTIEAGVPYLITYPAAHADIVNPVFNGITVSTTEPGNVEADGVTFQGMFAQVHIDPYTSSAREQDYLFLGANSQLYWPSSDQTSSSIKMRGFRAYFIIDRNSISPALAPKGTRARIMDAPKTTTAIDNTSAKFGGSEKIIENGILYIIRNGLKYNAQGQIVK